MIVRALAYDGFRNLKAGFLEPCETVNVIYGDNAQGKTNLLEAVWMFCGSKSFRTVKDRELIAFDGPRARLRLDFYGAGRDQQAELLIDDRRRATLNGVPLGTANKLAGAFCAVVFSPVHLSLIKDGPAMRRRFIDTAICQLRPRYGPLILDYIKTLDQKNALLKDLYRYPQMEDMLDVWDEKLAVLNSAIIEHRMAYTEKLKGYAAAFYNGFSMDREQLVLTYSTIDCAKVEKEAILQKLREARAQDIKQGHCTIGVHRDDLLIEIGGVKSRPFASQGQQRSAVLSLKLAEAQILKEAIDETPVILLDDVLSELDTNRQRYILNHLTGFQVFLTCCDPSVFLRQEVGRAFCVEDGVVAPRTVPDAVGADAINEKTPSPASEEGTADEESFTGDGEDTAPPEIVLLDAATSAAQREKQPIPTEEAKLDAAGERAGKRAAASPAESENASAKTKRRTAPPESAKVAERKTAVAAAEKQPDFEKAAPAAETIDNKPVDEKSGPVKKRGAKQMASEEQAGKESAERKTVPIKSESRKTDGKKAHDKRPAAKKDTAKKNARPQAPKKQTESAKPRKTTGDARDGETSPHE